MIEIIKASILDAPAKYIAHQCNCVSQKSAGLAKYLFDKFPYANVYETRKTPDSPGTISIKGNGEDQRLIINMFGQYYPGKPKYPNSSLDGLKVRENNFYQCLLAIAKIKNLESIAFPFGIGCGLAGGNWEYYFGVISNFEKYVYNKSKTKVTIYQLSE